jgi:E3 ubiquitin ligase
VASPTIAHYWLLAAGSAAAACWALARFAASIRRDRVVEDTPLVKIRSAAQGYVKVYGQVRATADGPVAAPLSSRSCVWWSFDVAERQRTSNNRTEWCSVESASSVTPFVLADADSECLVGPVNAEITPTTNDVWYGSEPRPHNAPPASRVMFESSNYRYTERLLKVGDLLSVVGELRSNSEISREDDAAVALLHQWKQDQKALLARFDADHDGRLNATEWEAARQAAAAEAETNLLKSPISRVSVIGEPVNGQPFMIAPMDAEHLVRREKRRAALFLVLGIACVALCGWAIEHAIALANVGGR